MDVHSNSRGVEGSTGVMGSWGIRSNPGRHAGPGIGGQGLQAVVRGVVFVSRIEQRARPHLDVQGVQQEGRKEGNHIKEQ